MTVFQNSGEEYIWTYEVPRKWRKFCKRELHDFSCLHRTVRV